MGPLSLSVTALDELWQSWLTLSIIVVVVFTFYHCFYCYFLHPLRKYPGPFLAKFSNAYAAYHSFKGDLHLDVRRNHERYGKYVRYGPSRLVVNSVKGMHDIYGVNPSIQKSISYKTMVPGPGANTSATTIDKSTHKSMRRTLASGFNPANLAKFEASVAESIDKYCKLLLNGPSSEDGWTKPQNMDDWNTWLGYDTISAYGYGSSIGLLDNPSVRYVAEVVKMHTVKLAVYEQWPLLDKLGFGWIVAVILASCSKLVRSFNQWHKRFAHIIISNNKSNSRGVFAPVIQNSQEFNRKGTHTPVQSLTEGSFITFTSADAHAGTLSSLQFYLAHFPAAYARLQEEVRSTFANLDDVRSGPALASCVYLRACIDETLRMTPTPPGVLWRESIGQGAFVDGKHMAPGLDVGTCVYSMHRDRDHFRNPDLFWPDRWLKGVLPEEEYEIAQSAFKPFSLGPRSCVGRSVGLNALTISVARLIYQVDFRLVEGSLGRVGEGSASGSWGRKNKDEFQFRTHFVAIHEGPFLSFRSAQGS